LREVSDELVRVGHDPAVKVRIDHVSDLFRMAHQFMAEQLFAEAMSAFALGGPSGREYRVPSYCWTPLLPFNFEGDAAWDAGDFELMIRRDAMYGPQFGAYENKTALIPDADVASLRERFLAHLTGERPAELQTPPQAQSSSLNVPIGEDEKVVAWIRRPEVIATAVERHQRKKPGERPSPAELSRLVSDMLRHWGRDPGPGSIAATVNREIRHKRLPSY
jgi:hypothetical protein